MSALAAERPVLQCRDLARHFAVGRSFWGPPRGVVRAVDGVDLEVAAGECLALVGESGSGKTTLGRCLMRLIEPSRGRVLIGGVDILALATKDLRRRRRHFQMIFQDPYGSLNPRMTVEQTLSEPLRIHRIVARSERRGRVGELLGMVGLGTDIMGRYPRQLSGGQRQRVGIARALATEPGLVIADEPVTALDVSVQAQVVNLLARLQEQLGLALLFIAHDLAVVEHLAHRVAVMYLGQIVELASVERLFTAPQHPYTAILLASIPATDPRQRRPRPPRLAAEAPSALHPPQGCRFHPRCPIAEPRCTREAPPLVERGSGHAVACHFPGQLPSDLVPVGTSDPVSRTESSNMP